MIIYIYTNTYIYMHAHINIYTHIHTHYIHTHIYNRAYMFLYEGTGIAWAFFLPAPVQYYLYIKVWFNGKYSRYVTNLGWFGQFHTKSSVWLHGQLLLLKSLVRSLPATLYTFYTILNMLSEWFKPTRSGSMVLSGHGKWLCSYIPRQLGSRTLVAGLWSGRVRGRTRS